MILSRFKNLLFFDNYRQIITSAVVTENDANHLENWLSKIDSKVYSKDKLLNTPNEHGITLLARATSMSVAQVLLNHGAKLCVSIDSRTKNISEEKLQKLEQNGVEAAANFLLTIINEQNNKYRGASSKTIEETFLNLKSIKEINNVEILKALREQNRKSNVFLGGDINRIVQTRINTLEALKVKSLLEEGLPAVTNSELSPTSISVLYPGSINNKINNKETDKKKFKL